MAKDDEVEVVVTPKLDDKALKEGDKLVKSAKEAFELIQSLAKEIEKINKALKGVKSKTSRSFTAQTNRMVSRQNTLAQNSELLSEQKFARRLEQMKTLELEKALAKQAASEEIARRKREKLELESIKRVNEERERLKKESLQREVQSEIEAINKIGQKRRDSNMARLKERLAGGSSFSSTYLNDPSMSLANRLAAYKKYTKDKYFNETYGGKELYNMPAILTDKRLGASVFQRAYYAKETGRFADARKQLGNRVGTFVSYKMLGAGYSMVASALGEATSAARDLEDSLAKTQAIAGVTDGTMDKLGVSILKLGSNSRYATRELAETATTLAQAGYSAGEIENLLGAVSRLGTATGTDLSTSVDVLTSALSLWNKQSTDAEEIVNSLTVAVNKTKAEITSIANGMQYAGATAAQMGVSFDETVAAMASVTNAGIKARGSIGTGFRALITELTKPTARLEAELKKVGLSFDDVSISSKGFIEVIKTMDKAGFDTERSLKGLERRAATFYNALRSQLDTYERVVESMGEIDTARAAEEVRLDTLTGQLNKFKNIWTEIFTILGEPFVAVFKTVMKILNELSGVLAKILEKTKSLFSFMQSNATRLEQSVGELDAYKQTISSLDDAYFDLIKRQNALRGNQEAIERESYKLIRRFDKEGKVVRRVAKDYEELVGQAQALREATSKQTFEGQKEVAQKAIKRDKDVSRDLFYSLSTAVFEKKGNGKNFYEIERLRDELVGAKGRESGIRRLSNMTGKELLQLRNRLFEGGYLNDDLAAMFAKSFASKTTIESAQRNVFDIFENQSARDAFAKNVITPALNESVRIADEFAERRESGEEDVIEVDLSAYGALQEQLTGVKAGDDKDERVIKAQERIVAEVVKVEEKLAQDVKQILADAKQQNKISQKQTEGAVRSKNVSDAFASLGTQKATVDKLRGVISLLQDSGIDTEEISKSILSLSSATEQYNASFMKNAEKVIKALDDESRRNNEVTNEQIAEFKKRLASDKATFEADRTERAKNWERSRPTYLNEQRFGGFSPDIYRKAAEADEWLADYNRQQSLLRDFGVVDRESRFTSDRIASLGQQRSQIQAARSEFQNKLSGQDFGYYSKGEIEKKIAQYDSEDLSLKQEQIELSAKLLELDEKKLELSEKLNNATDKNTDVLEDMAAGAKAYYGELMKQTASQNFMGEATYTVLSEFNSGLKTAISSIIRGTASLREAMLTMVQSIANALQQKAIDTVVDSLFTAGMNVIGASFSSMGQNSGGTAKIGSGSGSGGSGGTGFGTGSDGGTLKLGGSLGGKATGGLVRGGFKGRDSVPTMLMPGEYVMKKSAVDILGKDTLDKMNSAESVQSSSVPFVEKKEPSPVVTNVYVVPEKRQAEMTPNDVLVTISRDILQGGQTRQLIQQVVQGRY